MPRTEPEPHTLAIDVGGTGLKASVLDGGGQMLHERERVPTPVGVCPPDRLLAALDTLVAPLPPYQRVSLGFPGVVRTGQVLTAPHFQADQAWAGFRLAEALERRWGRPARILNDAEVQGLGTVDGKGLEVMLTLGTGLGTAVFRNGRLQAHLELAHHPLRKDMTYNDYVGNAALLKHGGARWRKRVQRMLDTVTALLLPDVLYLGGGNAKKLQGRKDVTLPPGTRIVSNDAGITGGLKLWDEKTAHAFET